jgi:hypothetical protein
MQVYFKFP